MPDLGSLVISITADISDLVSNLATAASSFSDAAASMADSAAITGSLGSVFDDTGTAIQAMVADASAGDAAISAMSGAFDDTGTALAGVTAGVAEAGNALASVGSEGVAAGAEAAEGADTAGGAFDGLANAVHQVVSFLGFGSEAKADGEQAAEGADEASSEFDKLNETIHHVIEALGVMEAIHWAEESVKGALELGEQLRNLALETGISTEHLQTMDFAATATGASIDRLAILVTRLSRSIQTPTGASALKYFGLQPSDMDDAYSGLVKLGERMAVLGTQSATVRSEFSQLFGPRNLQLLPAIEALGEFNQKLVEMGIILGESDVAKLDQANEAWNELGYIWKQDKAILAAELSPAIQAVLGSLSSMLVALGQSANGSKDFAAAGVVLANKIFDIAEAIVAVAIPTVKALGESIKDIAAIVEALAHPLDTFFGGIIRGFVGAETAALNFVTAGGFENLIKSIDSSGARAADSTDAFTKKILDGIEKLRAQANKPIDLAKMFGAGTGAGGAPAAPATQAALNQALAAAQAEAAGEKAILDARLANQKAYYEQEYALGQISRAQETADEIATANQQYELDRAALEKELAIAKEGGPAKQAEVQKINAQLEVLEQKHAGTIQSIQAKAAEQELADQRKVDEDKISAEQKAGEDHIALVTAQLAQMRETNQISGLQEQEALTALEQQKYEIQRKALEERLALLKQNAGATQDEYQKLYDQIRALDDKFATDMTTRRTKEMADWAAQVKTLMTPVENAFSQGFDAIISGITTKGDSIGKELTKMVKQWSLSLIKGGLQDLIFGAGNTGIGSDLLRAIGLPGGLVGSALSAFGLGAPPTVTTVGGVNVATGTTGQGFGPIGMPGLPGVPGSGIATSGLGGVDTCACIDNLATSLGAPLLGRGTEADLLAPLFGSFSSSLGDFGSGLDTFSTGLSDVLSPDAMSSLFGDAFGSSGSAVTDLLGTGFTNSASPVSDLFGSGFNASQGAVTNLFTNALTDSLGSLGGGVGGAGGGIGGGGIGGILGSILGSIVSGLSGGAGGTAGAGAGAGGGGGAGGGLGNILGDLGGLAGGFGIGQAGSSIGGLIGGLFGASGTGSAAGGIAGGLGAVALGLAMGNPFMIVGGLISLGEGIAALLTGRPKEEATQTIAQTALSSPDPVIQLLGLGAKKLAAAGIPISSPDAGPVFGPFFLAARELEDIVRWGPGGARDTHAQALDALTLSNVLSELGQSNGTSTTTLKAVESAWSAFASKGNPTEMATQALGAPEVARIKGLGVSFQLGGVVPWGTLAGGASLNLLHPGELVIPEVAATPLIDQINTGNLTGAGTLVSSGIQGLTQLVLGFERGGIIPSAQGGMDVGNVSNVLSLLHANEVVLPEELANKVRAFTAPAPASTSPRDVRPITQHFHFNVSAIDEKSVSQWLRDHKREIVDAVNAGNRVFRSN